MKQCAWRVDVVSGTLEALPAFDCRNIVDADGRSDGSFAALISPSINAEHELSAFDPDGRRLWMVKELHRTGGRPEDLVATTAIAVDSRDEACVLDSVKKIVQIYDRGGEYSRTIDLRKAWGRTPSYPAMIAADSSGGLMVEDFNGKSPLVWMSGDERVLLETAPRTVDGRGIVLRRFRFTPEDRIWCSDGATILRIDAKGTVDFALGSPPDPHSLREPAGVAVDGRGEIYVVDRLTGAVHVFDPSGKRLRVCVPDPGDLSGALNFPTIAMRDDGAVFVGGREMGPGCIEFTPDGRRVGRKRFDLDRVTEDWHAQPGSDHFWVVGYEALFLVDGSGKVLRKIERSADDQWLRHARPAAVAPDGSIVVAAAGKIHTFSRDGDPLRSVPLPAATLVRCLAFDGHRIAVAAEADVLLFNADGSSGARFHPEALEKKGGPNWCFVAGSGTELWLAGRDVGAVLRFRLP
jgi:hypothetical protein